MKPSEIVNTSTELSKFSKDEALRAAKLEYLTTAKGRTLSPQYWAGLVLIGDTSPIDISTTSHWWIWLIAMTVIALILVFFIRTFKSSKL